MKCMFTWSLIFIAYCTMTNKICSPCSVGIVVSLVGLSMIKKILSKYDNDFFLEISEASSDPWKIVRRPRGGRDPQVENRCYTSMHSTASLGYNFNLFDIFLSLISYNKCYIKCALVFFIIT